MLLADKKKRENISEYIIYMYQTEMLIRNFEFDIDKIKALVFTTMSDEQLVPEKKQELLDWYAVVMKQMISEGIEKEGHLSYVQQEVDTLSNLSIELLTQDEQYKAIFNAARPSIRENIQASQGLISNPIQICLNGVFGLVIARINGTEVPEETMQQLEHFGNVLSYLSLRTKE